MSRETHPLTFIDPVCGKPWVHVASIPAPTDLVDAARLEHLDGRAVSPLDQVRCESCGRAGGAEDLFLVTKAEHYIERKG